MDRIFDFLEKSNLSYKEDIKDFINLYKDSIYKIYNNPKVGYGEEILFQKIIEESNNRTYSLFFEGISCLKEEDIKEVLSFIKIYGNMISDFNNSTLELLHLLFLVPEEFYIKFYKRMN
jgi:hypothetical protein